MVRTLRGASVRRLDYTLTSKQCEETGNGEKTHFGTVVLKESGGMMHQANLAEGCNKLKGNR
jgi:hypothetical protein